MTHRFPDGAPRTIAAAAMLAAVVACSDSVAPTSRAPARVQATSDSVVVGVGDTTRLAALVLDAGGRDIRDSLVRWRTLDPATATVDAATGLATGVAVGSARLVAASGALADTVRLTVTRRVASISLTVPGDSVFLGTSFAATAVARDAQGVVIADAPLLWSSSDSALIRVTSTGGVYVRDEGSADLRVGSGAVVVRRSLRAVYRRLDFGALRPVQVSMGPSHACALDADGRAFCWGADLGGNLGSGVSNVSNFTPTEVVGGHRFTAIQARDRSTCGLTTGSRLLCWGQNSFSPRRSPTPLPILDSIPTVAFAVGMHGQSCALGNDDVVRCWGHNDTYQLGRAPLSGYDTMPMPVTGTQRFRRSVSLGGFGGCALDQDGMPWCWGYGGILAPDAERDRPLAVPGGRAFVQVASYMQDAACGLTQSGEVWCWGYPYDGADGPGSATPVRIAGIPPMRRLDGDWDKVCGIGTNGEVWCWWQSSALTAAGIAGTSPQAWRFGGTRTFRDFFVSANPLAPEGVCGILQDGAVLCRGGVIVPQR